MGTKKHITIRHDEADGIRDLVTVDANGNKNYDRAGRVLVGLLNLFGTGMCGVDTDHETAQVLGNISERLVREDIQQIENDRRRKKKRGRNCEREKKFCRVSGLGGAFHRAFPGRWRAIDSRCIRICETGRSSARSQQRGRCGIPYNPKRS